MENRTKITQQEKQLLLKDLCARLPHGVVVHIYDINIDDYDRQLIPEDIDFFQLSIRNCKPYLRPLSSMTKEENEEYIKRNLYGFHWDFVDWCNSKHLDYRGLIPKGLAIEVTKENNPYK